MNYSQLPLVFDSPALYIQRNYISIYDRNFNYLLNLLDETSQEMDKKCSAKLNEFLGDRLTTVHLLSMVILLDLCPDFLTVL
jgi:hypothetical protein